MMIVHYFFHLFMSYFLFSSTVYHYLCLALILTHFKLTPQFPVQSTFFPPTFLDFPPTQQCHQETLSFSLSAFLFSYMIFNHSFLQSPLSMHKLKRPRNKQYLCLTLFCISASPFSPSNLIFAFWSACMFQFNLLSLNSTPIRLNVWNILGHMITRSYIVSGKKWQWQVRRL